MSTHTFHPGPGKRYPVVLFYMDGVGIRDTLFDVARRVAAQGYYVALPDLYYRAGPVAPFKGATVFVDPGERERVNALIKEVTPPRVRVDTAALLDALARDPVADTARVGTVGYCMGGGPALHAAGWFPERVRAAASYHGSRLATDAPESPHVTAARATGRLYVGYAENDRSFPEEQAQRLAAALSAAGVSHTIELYHAAHGFVMPDLPAYNRAAADRHWDTLLALLRATLG